MTEHQGRLLDRLRRKSSPLNIIAWIGIGLLLVLIAAWTVWAGHQPDLHSIWAPD